MYYNKNYVNIVEREELDFQVMQDKKILNVTAKIGHPICVRGAV